MINKQAIIIGDLTADLEHAILELEARDATITELRLLEASAEANRDIGTPPNEQDFPPVGGQDQTGPPANLTVPSGGGPAAPLTGHANVRQEKDDEIFLTDKGRWENMGTYKENKNTKTLLFRPQRVVRLYFPVLF